MVAKIMMIGSGQTHPSGLSLPAMIIATGPDVATASIAETMVP
jgi:hypothetical protein